MPLLNTCLEGFRPSAPNRTLSFTVIFCICTMLVLPTSVGDETMTEETAMNHNSDTVLDVMVIDLPCDNETLCESSRPSHLVEYFGADWCEPCQPLELMLESMASSDVAIIQHHPSIIDLTYLNYSHDKFANQYRLLFIPSIVIDSSGLLTGSEQGMELNHSLSQLETNFTGIDDLSMSNGILYWNTSTNLDLTVWKMRPTAHEFDNRTHPALAVDMRVIQNNQTVYNLSEWTNDPMTRLVFVLHDDKATYLQSISPNPTGAKNLNEPDGEFTDFLSHDGSYDLAIVAFLALVLCLLPALIWFRKLQKQDSQEAE